MEENFNSEEFFSLQKMFEEAKDVLRQESANEAYPDMVRHAFVALCEYPTSVDRAYDYSPGVSSSMDVLGWSNILLGVRLLSHHLNVIYNYHNRFSGANPFHATTWNALLVITNWATLVMRHVKILARPVFDDDGGQELVVELYHVMLYFIDRFFDKQTIIQTKEETNV